MLIIVKVGRWLCLWGKMCDLYFQPNKIHYQPENYITLKLVQSSYYPNIYSTPFNPVSANFVP